MTDGIRSWEYKVAAIELGGHDAGMSELSRLGNEGWELVQVLGEPSRGGGRLPFVFKRPRPQRAQPLDVNDENRRAKFSAARTAPG